MLEALAGNLPEFPKRPLRGNFDVLNLTRPDIIKEIHKQYFEAGADITGIDGTFGLAGPHHGVDLVDEDDGLAFVLRDFLQHTLEPFLELAATIAN